MDLIDAKTITTITIAVKHQIFMDYIKSEDPTFKLSKFVYEKLDEEMKKRKFDINEVIKNESKRYISDS